MNVPTQSVGAAAKKAAAPALFYVLLGLAVVGLSAGYAALVLYSASWVQVAALRDFYDWQPRAYTAGEFWGLRHGLALLAVLALGSGAGLGLSPAGRAQGRLLGQELRVVWRRLGAGWWGLTAGQRRGALGLLLALTALRLYYSRVIAPGDDGVSYELFVRASLLTVSAAYPIPNNHVLANTVAWLFYQVDPGFWWSMRLPVLLTATGATALWFLVLLRQSNFRVALLAVTAFSALQVNFYQAVTGRGYWLLVGLGAVGFLAVLALGSGRERSPGGVRASGLGLVLSGVLGLYGVPTHAYFLVAAYGWLGVGQVRGGRWGAVGMTGFLGVLTLLGAGLLYGPLLLVSGAGQLFGNAYVRALGAGVFWQSLPGYVWRTEGWLSGHRWLGPLPLLAVLAASTVLWRRARAGRLPADLAVAVRRLAPVSSWFIGAPYLLVVVQRVQAPERALFYKSLLVCVLLALLVDWAWRAAARRGTRAVLRVGLAGVGLLGVASQVGLVARYNQGQVRIWQGYRQAMAWLATQPQGPVLAPEVAHWLVLRFYAHTEFGSQAWQIEARPRPGVRYRYRARRPGPSAPGERAAFAGDMTRISVLY